MIDNNVITTDNGNYEVVQKTIEWLNSDNQKKEISETDFN